MGQWGVYAAGDADDRVWQASACFLWLLANVVLAHLWVVSVKSLVKSSG
jgi:hypothetical protein